MSNTSLAQQGFRTTQDGTPGSRKMSRITHGDLIKVERWGIPIAQVRLAYTTSDGVRVLEWAAYNGDRSITGVLAGDENLPVAVPGLPLRLPRRVPLVSAIAAKRAEMQAYDLAYCSLRDGSMRWHQWRDGGTWDDYLSDSERQTAAEAEALTAWDIASIELAEFKRQQDAGNETALPGGRAA